MYKFQTKLTLSVLVLAFVQCSTNPTTSSEGETGEVPMGVAQDIGEIQRLAMSLKAAVDFASVENLESVDDFDGGYLDIPPDVAVSALSHGSRVENGVITVTWRNDGSSLDGITYILRANSFTYPIIWTEEGSCLQQGLCENQLN